MPFRVHFVHDQNDLPRSGADHCRKLAVQRRHAIDRVSYKKNHIRTPHRDESSLARALGKVRVRLGSNAAGIGDLKRSLSEFANRANAVAGHAGLVMDDGNLASRKTVEEGRLSDIRTAYDGDISHL